MNNNSGGKVASANKNLSLSDTEDIANQLGALSSVFRGEDHDPCFRLEKNSVSLDDEKTTK